MKSALKFAEYLIKPNKSILLNYKVKSWENLSCKLVTNPNGEIAKTTRANIGDMSLWLEADFREKLPEAALEVDCMFKELPSVEKVIHRPKSTLSTEPKLLSEIKNTENNSYNSIQEAAAKVLDGIGSRVITKSLDKLSSKEIKSMVDNMIYKNNPLDAKQKKLLMDYICEKPIHHSLEKEAYSLFREFAQPLIEKRSKDVVEQLTLSILKYRVTTGDITLKALENQGFNRKFLDRMFSEHALPYNITKISNYAGPHGLPEFSDSQIQELYKALNTGKKGSDRIIINTAGQSLSLYYPQEQITEMSKSVTKQAGYRTAQLNIIHVNGAKGEIQFRGAMTNLIAEYEHIAYDLRQGKNTIGPIFSEYTDAISKLSDKDYSRYNEYLEKWYNYYNRLELGLPAKKPQLPKGLNKVLSKENLEKLYHENHYSESKTLSHFGPYVIGVA